MATDQDVSRRDFLQRLSVVGVAGLGAGSLLAACGGSDGDGSDESSQGGTVTLHPEGNQMQYQETEFTVSAGQEVTLVFENTATSPAMQHNVVILNTEPTDKVFRRVGQAGVQAGSTEEYVPDDPAVLAATSMSKPGETVSVTFTTPSEPGDYGYLCTFPGHWATMRGTMHVE